MLFPYRWIMYDCIIMTLRISLLGCYFKRSVWVLQNNGEHNCSCRKDYFT
jgi:hypothetical protein